MKSVIWFVVTALSAYALIVAALYLLQRSLMYHPNDERPRPTEHGIRGMDIVSVPSHDGLELYSWWLPPSTDASAVIVYFHGNAGTLANRIDRARHFQTQGYGVLFAGYRYNAGAGGAPSEDALIADGAAALEWLRNKGITDSRIVLYGESLGSGVAIALAANGAGAAVVVEGGYDAIVEIAQAQYWFAPVRLLMKDRFDSRPRAAASSKPILIVHGEDDRVIPLRHARALHATANDPKELVVLANGGHVDLYEHGMAAKVEDFISRHVRPSN